MSKRFLSTPSARRATTPSKRTQRAIAISIHALREEGDHRNPGALPHLPDFYPRPPRGGRLQLDRYCAVCQRFLSTPSARRATHCDGDCEKCPYISIHALREEGDTKKQACLRTKRNFYPRPPRGGRPPAAIATEAWVRFLSTPSARRATSWRLSTAHSSAYFYPRPPRGGRRRPRTRTSWRSSYFYPRPPRGGRHVDKFIASFGTVISIHALREEGDSKNRDKISIFKQIIQHSARI